MNNLLAATILYLVQSSSGVLYYHGHIGDVTFNFLVDTGSSYTVLTREVVKKVDKRMIERKGVVGARLSNGKAIRLPHYVVKEMWIGLCRVTNVNVLVIRKGTNLLGMETLKKVSPFSISFEPQTIMTVNC